MSIWLCPKCGHKYYGNPRTVFAICNFCHKPMIKTDAVDEVQPVGQKVPTIILKGGGWTPRYH